MMLRPAYAALLAGGLLALAWSWGGMRVGAAQQRASAAQQRLEDVTSKAERILALRALEQRVATSERPQQDVISRINGTLAEVGIATSKLTRLEMESDLALPTHDAASAGTYRQQALRFGIERVTVEQAGAFLAAWRQEQRLWLPTRIELSHVRGAVPPDLYDVGVQVTATYLATPGSQEDEG
jgi:hypothetical protein